jgi:hypothetical protein
VIAAGFGLRGPFFLAGGVWVVVFGLTVPIVNNRRIEALTSRPDTLA